MAQDIPPDESNLKPDCMFRKSASGTNELNFIQWISFIMGILWLKSRSLRLKTVEGRVWPDKTAGVGRFRGTLSPFYCGKKAKNILADWRMLTGEVYLAVLLRFIRGVGRSFPHSPW